MSRLEELIAELCPDGVEYRAFGESATIVRGASPRPIKNFITTEPTGVNWIKIGDVKPGDKYITASAEKITQEGAKKSRTVKKGDFILSNSMSFGRPYILQIDGCIHDGWLAISDYSDSYLSDFLYHLLNSNSCQSEMRKKASFGGAVQNLNADIVRALVLPVPPLEVQREIVRVLDSFTLLTAELTAELTARKKQYDFYRDKLLTFESDIPLLPIKEVVKKSCAGATPAKGNSEYYEGGTIPWIRTQDVRFNEITEVNSFITEKAVEETAAKWIPENCVIVAISGATAGRCAINKIKATTNQHCLNMQIDAEKALYKYVYYCICSKQDELISKKQGARGDLNSSLILGTKIPVPTLEIQKKIVHVLDNFESICADLNIGLPAEIEARQKQYEYYRDLLLTFAETGSTLVTDRQTDRQTGDLI